VVARILGISALVLTLPVFVMGCNNDFLGLFASTDFSRRWQVRETFHLLSDDDRNLPLGADGAYSFIVVTDTHIRGDDGRGLDRLERVIDDDVKFVIILGDITQTGSQTEIERFIDIAGNFGVPVFPVIGNHDVFFGNWPAWEGLIGSTVYRVNIGDDALLVLDSANAFFGARQLDWLENELRDSRGRVFVFTHVSMFTRGTLHFDPRERARVVSMLDGRVDAVFMGHSHLRHVVQVGGVHYVTLEDFKGNSAFLRVFVSRDDLRWEFGRL